MEGVAKRLGRTQALVDLSLVVHPGEVHGFMGPNGAGKSTAIRVLLGLLRADAGRVEVLGADPWSDVVTVHRRLAAVPGDVALWPELTGGEVLDLLASMRGGVRRRRQDELVEAFGLDPRRRCRTYSKGNRQKVALVAAFAAEPELLLLDEPTAGLDPLVDSVFAQEIARHRERGGSVLLSSHVLAEVERLCDRFTIIGAGRTLETGSLRELQHLTRTSVDAVLDRRPALEGHPGVHALSVRDQGPGGGHRVRCDVDAPALPAFVAAIGPCGVRSLVSHPPTLEELFLRHYPRPGTRR